MVYSEPIDPLIYLKCMLGISCNLWALFDSCGACRAV